LNEHLLPSGQRLPIGHIHGGGGKAGNLLFQIIEGFFGGGYGDEYLLFSAKRRLQQACPAGEEFLHYALHEGAGSVPALLPALPVPPPPGHCRHRIAGQTEKEPGFTEVSVKLFPVIDRVF